MRYSEKFLIKYKSLIFSGIVLIIWIFAIFVIWAPLYFYMGSAVEKMRQENANILKFYAALHGNMALENELSPLFLKYVFDEIILRTDIPIINTDEKGVPLYWEGIDIAETDKSDQAVQAVKKIVESLQGEIEPIPLVYKDPVSQNEKILGYLYYGDSKIITRLRYLPYIEIVVMSVFILIGIVGSFLVFKNIKKSEQRFIWVGMAKETAHQLGTPLSSLMGWLEIIKSNEHECELTRKTIGEMEKDVNRLYKVAERFSQIGSRADLILQDVRPILSDVINYIKRRLPHMGKEVKIIEDFADVPDILLNRALFEWVIENLLKNSIDAIKTQKGEIIIKVHPNRSLPGRINIDIQDNGIGILPINKSLIFNPGYSTKKRGWGLGLNLAQRIVEEYHSGKLLIKETKVDEGTTMRIIL